MENAGDTTDVHKNSTDSTVSTGHAEAGSPADAGGSSGHADPAESFGPEGLDVERELTVFLRRARASSGEMARQVHPDLEPAAYGLLVRLEDAGEQRATELATYFGVGKATISRQLHALERLGLVDRRPDPADRRASLVRLTTEGHERFTRVRDARRLSYARKLAAWDRREIAELARLLHRFNSLADQEE
ncbi:MarR family winged helix-turn-helix transcriptional regulator [Streptomyces oryzae]|uniref:MarR family winged helix-turn-helix transcriptional regulator n=1 Tax=Streptomyces oryzae TaxID=1434886 RepID=UPI001FFE2BE1|nr:MarR family transcriptional regulator [Streptomyces oryzae]